MYDQIPWKNSAPGCCNPAPRQNRYTVTVNSYFTRRKYEVIEEFPRIRRLPPYVFNIVNDLIVNDLGTEARSRGEDIIDFGMGNPDQPTPAHIVNKLVEVAQRSNTHLYSVSRGMPPLTRAITNWYRDRFDVDLHPE